MPASGFGVRDQFETCACRPFPSGSPERGKEPSTSVQIDSTRGVSIKVQELQPGGFQPLHKHLRETFHELVAHGGIALAFSPQALAVEADRPHFLYGTHVEGPTVWRK